MNNWEKLKAISIALSSVAIPLVVGFVGHAYTKAIAEREIQAKFVELGVRILQQEPSEHTRNLRKWAVDVLNAYSGVPLNEATREDLIERVPIPAAPERARVTPETPVSVSGFHLRLTACKRDGDAVHCKLMVTPPPGIEDVAIQIVGFSPAYKQFLLSAGGQVTTYSHGPPLAQLIRIAPNQSNQFEVAFRGATGTPPHVVVLVRAKDRSFELKIEPE